MSPDNSVIKGGAPQGGTARALVEPARAMAIYVRKHSSTVWGMQPPLTGQSVGPTALQIELTEGLWQAEWLDPKTGKVVSRTRAQGGGIRTLDTPSYDTDIALRLRRQ